MHQLRPGTGTGGEPRWEERGRIRAKEGREQGEGKRVHALVLVQRGSSEHVTGSLMDGAVRSAPKGRAPRHVALCSQGSQPLHSCWAPSCWHGSKQGSSWGARRQGGSAQQQLARHRLHAASRAPHQSKAQAPHLLRPLARRLFPLPVGPLLLLPPLQCLLLRPGSSGCRLLPPLLFPRCSAPGLGRSSCLFALLLLPAVSGRQGGMWRPEKRRQGFFLQAAAGTKLCSNSVEEAVRRTQVQCRGSR